MTVARDWMDWLYLHCKIQCLVWLPTFGWCKSKAIIQDSRLWYVARADLGRQLPEEPSPTHCIIQCDWCIRDGLQLNFHISPLKRANEIFLPTEQSEETSHNNTNFPINYCLTSYTCLCMAFWLNQSWICQGGPTVCQIENISKAITKTVTV